MPAIPCTGYFLNSKRVAAAVAATGAKKAQESDDDEEAVGRLIGGCEAHFCNGEFNMRLLFAMAYGIKDKDGRVIADWEGEPYASVKKTNKKTFKPTKEQLWTKVEHHANALGLPVP